MIDDKYSFGPFRIDRTSLKLLRDDTDVGLRQKAVKALAVLVENAGRVVTYEELGTWVWGGNYSDENTIKSTVSTVRTSLRDHKVYIQNFPRIGYRFNHPERADDLPQQPRRKPQSVLLTMFKDLSGDQGKAFLAPSLTFELEKALSRVDGLHVIKAAPETKQFLGKQQLAEIRYMVGGSVAGSESRPRVNVELLALPEASVVWSDSYPTTFAQLQGLHSEIAAKIAEVVKVKINFEEMRKMSDEKVDGETYKLFLRGVYHWSRPTEVDLFRAINYFRRATARQETYARAFGAMSHAYGLMGFAGFLKPDDAMPQARDAALKCLQLLPTSAEGLAGLAAVEGYYLWDWQKSEKLLKRSIGLNPEYETAHHLYAMGCLLPQVRLKEALREIRVAETINPLSPFIITCAGIIHYYARDNERAIEQCDRALELQPHYHLAHWHRGWALAELERFDEAISAVSAAVQTSQNSPQVLAALAQVFAIAGRTNECRRILNQLKTLSRDHYVSPYDLALIHAALKNDAKTLALLKSAVDQRVPMLARLPVHPVFDRFRSDSKFLALLEVVHLPPNRLADQNQLRPQPATKAARKTAKPARRN
ncbi:MAG: hypothetical protein QOH41_753 [Blastocatellia bacterium]|nr:hypothetical protein [Blastocatellia bacterium]